MVNNLVPVIPAEMYRTICLLNSIISDICSDIVFNKQMKDISSVNYSISIDKISETIADRYYESDCQRLNFDNIDRTTATLLNFKEIESTSQYSIWLIPTYMWDIIPEGTHLYICRKIYNNNVDNDVFTGEYRIDKDPIIFRRKKCTFEIINGYDIHRNSSIDEYGHLMYGIRINHDASYLTRNTK